MQGFVQVVGVQSRLERRIQPFAQLQIEDLEAELLDGPKLLGSAHEGEAGTAL